MNPLTLTLASPAPPPCSVAYTLGVVFNTIGISRDPNLSVISALVSVVEFVGEFCPDLEARTSSADNSTAETAKERLTVTSPLTFTLLLALA